MKEQRFHGRVGDGDHQCAWPGCSAAGEFRAPPAQAQSGLARYDGPGQWRWFCLEHIRAFNSGYDYFAGMSAEEIYSAQRPVSGWERETRAFSARPVDAPRWGDFDDPLDAIGARFKDNLKHRSGVGVSAAPQHSKADSEALKTLGLRDDADRKAIRRRYSALVRKYHPDRNGGDRSHEKALAKVIAAYTQLKNSAAFS